VGNRHIGAALAVLTTILTLLAGIEPARAGATTTDPAVGVQFHATWSDYTDTQRVAMLDKLASANIRWVRIDIGWTSLEPAKGQYDAYHVGILDRVVAAANARGIKVLGTLWRTPAWANGGRSVTTPPTNAADYASIARWVAARYRGKIAAWEVWNEPNLASFFVNADPVAYAALVRAAYPAIKSGDPGAVVVAGSVSQNDTAWLARMYDAGVQGAFDVLSTHPYPGPSDASPDSPDDGKKWTVDHIGAVHDLMVARGDGTKKIWATEIGWSVHANTGTEANWDRGVTEQQQADYSMRALDLFAARHPYVTNVFFYNERDKATGKVHQDGFGMLRRDMSEKLLFGRLRDRLSGASTVAPTTTTPTLAPTTPTIAPTTTTIAPTTTTTVAPTTGTTKPKPRRKGYSIATSPGSVVRFPETSTVSATLPGGESIVGAAYAAGRTWVTGERGAVAGVDGAPSFGALSGTPLNQPIVGIAARPNGDGYWLVARDGGVFSFGAARFLGSTGAIKLNQPIVGIASTPSGAGYWLVASDGGIFAFGDARFLGSTGATKLNRPIVGMASTPSGRGYWLTASDGGVFTFGDAPFLGSTGAIPLNQPIVSMASTATGKGYWFVARDGGVFTFGDASFEGSAAGLGIRAAAIAPLG